MRWFPIAAAAVLVLAILASCVPQRAENAGPGHPNLIVVREFAFSPGVVTLDPSFGFSLNRGEPGVPPTQRAQTVGRAAAFSLADAITQELTSLGYDVVHVDAATPDPSGRALVVSGAFRSIFEGRRRENASIDAETEVDFRSGAAAMLRLTSFNLASRRLSLGGPVPAAGRHGDNVNYQATCLGAAIGRYVGDLARINRWPGAAR